MTDNTEALPPLPEPDGWAVGDCYYPNPRTKIAMGDIRFGTAARRYTEEQVRAALAQRQQVPVAPAVNIAGAALLPPSSGRGWVSSCGCGGSEQYVNGELVRSEYKCHAHAAQAAPSAQAEPVKPQLRENTAEPVRDIVDRLRDKSGAWINGLYDDEAADEIEALRIEAYGARAALAQRQQVPEGWVLVPKKPTPEMVSAGRYAYEDKGWNGGPAIFSAMLAAAPALTAAPSAQAEPCQWCCGTGRFADHACRFCAGKAKGSVFAAPSTQEPDHDLAAAWKSGARLQYLVITGHDDDWTDYTGMTPPDLQSSRLAWRIAPGAAPSAQAEPVAWRYRYSAKARWNYADGPANDPAVIEEPLYAAPPAAQAEPLTDEQCDRVIAGMGLGYLVRDSESNRDMLRELCRRAHGIGKQEG